MHVPRTNSTSLPATWMTGSSMRINMPLSLTYLRDRRNMLGKLGGCQESTVRRAGKPGSWAAQLIVLGFMNSKRFLKTTSSAHPTHHSRNTSMHHLHHIHSTQAHHTRHVTHQRIIRIMFITHHATKVRFGPTPNPAMMPGASAQPTPSAFYIY